MKFRRDLSHLLLLFDPQAGEQNSRFPDELSPGIVLTHDALGGMRYSLFSFFDLIGAADENPITMALAARPAWNRVFYIHNLNFWTDDNVARNLYLAVGDALGNEVVVDNQTSAQNRWLPYRGVGRLIMPPGSFLKLYSESILSAGKKLRFSMHYVSVPIGEHVPRE